MSYDPNKLPEDLRKKIEGWEANSPANKALKAAEQAMEAVEEVKKKVQLSNMDLSLNIPDMSKHLKPLETMLETLNESVKQSNDNSSILDAVQSLSQDIVAQMKAIKIPTPQVTNDLKPNISVASPDVHVSTDLSGVEKALKNDMPKAFKDAIKGIPKTEIPEHDNSDIVDKLEDMLDKLESIDTATRMKPQPGTMKVTNPDGSPIGGGSGGAVTNAGTFAVQLNASQSNTTGSITANGQSITVTDLVGVGSATVQISGTYSGLNAIFEVSVDAGTTWAPMAAQMIGSAGVTPSTTTGVLAANSTNLYNLSPLLGIAQLRLRATAFGAGTANVIIAPSAQFVEYYGASTVTDGTNAASVVAGDTGFNGITIANGVKTIPFSTSAAGVQTLLANTDVRGYAWMSVTLTSQGTGLTWSGQWSATSGGSYTSFSIWSSLAGTVTSTAANLTTTTGNTSEAAIHGNFFQLVISALTSGTVSGYVTLSTLPRNFTSMGVSAQLLAGTASVGTVGSNSATGSAVPANAFYMGASLAGTLTGMMMRSSLGDASTNTTGGALQVVNYPQVYNGTSWDLNRSATAASGTTGTGLLGVGNLMFDGTNWQNLRTSNTSDGRGGVEQLQQMPFLYNGTNGDRQRNNTSTAVIAAGTTTTQTGINITTYNANKLELFINITAITGTLTVAVNGVSVSSYSTNILTSTALATTGLTVLRIFPGATPATSLVANDMLPRNISITATVTGSCTYGIDNILGV